MNHRPVLSKGGVHGNAVVRAILVDDDAGSRAALRHALQSVPDIEISAEYDNGRSAVEGIERQRPDLVFLDIEMPGMNGLEVAATLTGDDAPPVIFVTAYDRHAITAFEMHAVDYVLKPFEVDRVREATRRAQRRIAADRHDAADDGFRALLRSIERGVTAMDTDPHMQRFVVRDNGRMRFVPVADVDWIEAERNYIRLHVGSATHLVRGNLSRILDDLDPKQFRRIHRSTAVNVDRIAEILPWMGGDCIAVLRDGARLRVSRTRRRALLGPPD